LDFQIDEKSLEKVKIEERIIKIEELLGDKNTYYASHYSKAESLAQKKDFLNALIEYENCNLLRPDSDELHKKIHTLKATMFPEEILAKRYLDEGARAMDKLEIASAIECFKILMI
jgi:hypothetical protein